MAKKLKLFVVSVALEGTVEVWAEDESRAKEIVDNTSLNEVSDVFDANNKEPANAAYVSGFDSEIKDRPKQAGLSKGYFA